MVEIVENQQRISVLLGPGHRTKLGLLVALGMIALSTVRGAVGL